MKHVGLILLILLFTASSAFAADGLLYRGDNQQIQVESQDQTTKVILNNDGTITLNAKNISDTDITALETGVSTNAGNISTNSGNISTNSGDISTLQSGKADKVSAPTNGNVAGLDATGNLTDSGVAAADILERDGSVAMTGNLNLGTTNKIVNLSAGTASTDAVNKGQLDAAISGLSWRDPVDEVEVDSATLEVTLAAGVRVLIAGTGIGDFATHDGEIAVRNGTNDGWDFTSPVSSWALFDEATDAGYTYDGSAWIQFSGAGQVNAGAGLDKSGNTLSVKTDDVTIEVNGSDQLQVKDGAITNAKVNASAAIVESKLSLDYSTSGLNTAITNHTGDATIHFVIDDVTADGAKVYSSNKVVSLLSGKSDTGHAHTASDVTDFTTAARATVSASGLITYTGASGIFSLANTDIDHDQLTNFSAAEHFVINDSSTLTTEVFSASKINTLVAGLATSSHDHTASDITDFTTATRSNVSATGLITYTGATGVFTLANTDIDHDQLTNFSAAEHFIINDASDALTEVLSANKLNDLLDTKATINGDSLTANLVLGTNDAYDLVLEVNNVAFVTLDQSEDMVVVEKDLSVTGQHIEINGGKGNYYNNSKASIAETTDVTFATIDVAASKFMTVRVTLGASVGDSISSGMWFVSIFRASTGDVAITNVQQIGTAKGAGDSAVEDIQNLIVKAVVVDADTVGLQVNATVAGTGGATAYNAFYDLSIIGDIPTDIAGQ